MAYIELNTSHLVHNYNFLVEKFSEHNKEWSLVSKLLCGEESFLNEVIALGVMEICDARISNLKRIKELSPGIRTVYIKPPARTKIREVVQFADVSFNTEIETICWLSEEAGKQGKIHNVIIMIELGDLREGVMGDDLMAFYERVFRMPNIQVSGIGTNLNCLNGVRPSQDKLVQLCLYKQLIEARFKRTIPWVTGGTSAVLPLLLQHQVPEGVNHFRVGETLFFGNDLLAGKPIEGMKTDVLQLYGEIIEISQKPKVPIGYIGENPSGLTVQFSSDDYGTVVNRAIIDVGVLDVADTDFLIPNDPSIRFIGSSSDVLVLDIDKANGKYKVGDKIGFQLKYMGALRLLNSPYIDKVLA